MTESIYLVDFRNGVVTEIAPGDAPEALPERAGYVLAALGTPPRREDHRE